MAKIIWKNNISFFKHIAKHLLGINQESYFLEEIDKWKQLLGEEVYNKNVEIFQEEFKHELMELSRNYEDFDSDYISDDGIDSELGNMYFECAKKLLYDGLNRHENVLAYEYSDSKYNDLNYVDRRNGNSMNMLVGAYKGNRGDYLIKTCFFLMKFEPTKVMLMNSCMQFYAPSTYKCCYITNDDFMLDIISDAYEREIDQNGEYIEPIKIDLIFKYLHRFFSSCCEKNDNSNLEQKIYSSLSSLFGDNRLVNFDQEVLQWTKEITKHINSNSLSYFHDNYDDNVLFDDDVCLAMLLQVAFGNYDIYDIYNKFAHYSNRNCTKELFIEMVLEIANEIKKSNY